MQHLKNIFEECKLDDLVVISKMEITEKTSNFSGVSRSIGLRDTGGKMSLEFVKPERINLKTSPEFNEKWVQTVIAEDPSILGLGDLILKNVEKIQPHAGRLDLLLQDEDAKERYEVEIQLGEVDETHIIRTIEYWDIERKRYPQYDHYAVIIAEDITVVF
jgi:hypothetical protein